MFPEYIPETRLVAIPASIMDLDWVYEAIPEDVTSGRPKD